MPEVVETPAKALSKQLASNLNVSSSSLDGKPAHIRHVLDMIETAPQEKKIGKDGYNGVDLKGAWEKIHTLCVKLDQLKDKNSSLTETLLGHLNVDKLNEAEPMEVFQCSQIQKVFITVLESANEKLKKNFLKKIFG